MNVFEQQYKRRISKLKREEDNIIISLKLFHPEEMKDIMVKLEQRTARLSEMYETTRLKKYSRDGLRPRSTPEVMNDRSEEFSNSSRKYMPINLADRPIDEALLNLCSKGPSFVPTPTAIDWNDLQETWLQFKRKVRWRSFFMGVKLHHRKEKEMSLLLLV